MNTDFFGTIDRTSYFSSLNAGVKLIVSFALIIAALIVRDPLTSGILFALELLGFILVGFRLGDSLAQTFKLPARFVLATIAALRLVGILFAEWNALGQARRARGLGAGQSLAGRAQTFGGQSFALLVQAIRRGSRLAITMEARGFGAGERTWARVPSYSRRDVHVSIAAAVIIAVAYGVSIAAGTIQFLWG